MDLNALISLIGIPASIDVICKIIRNAKNYIAKFFIAKNTIDTAIFDLYLNGIDIKIFDEITKKDIEEILNDKDQTFDIKKLMENIEVLLKDKGLNSAQTKMISFIIVENFIRENSIYDKNGVLLQKLYLDFDNLRVTIEKTLEEFNKYKNIKSLSEIEREIVNDVKKESIIKNFDLRYFKVDDTLFMQSFDEFLYNNETELKIACFIKEEALYCILNYLKYEKGYDKVYVIYDEKTWDKLQTNDLKETILIPYFKPKNYYKLHQGTKQIFLYTKDEENIDGYSIELRKRTYKTLIEILEKEYNYYDSYKLIAETNGNYYLIKKKIFNCLDELYDYNSKIQKEQIQLLLLINSISDIDNDNKILLEYLNLDFKSLIDEIYKSKIYSKLFNFDNKYEPKCINLLDSKSVWQKYRIYENINLKKWKEIYETAICDNGCSKLLKLSLLKSFALLKFYSDNNSLCDDAVNLLLKQIVKAFDWDNNYYLIDMCVEINANIVIDRIYDEVYLNKNTGLINYFKDTKNQVYYKILWLIEKSLYLCDDIEKPLECLFLLCKWNYENNGNNPKEIIRKLLFPGMSRPKRFTECKNAIEKLSKKYTDIDIWDICYANINGGISFAWNTPKIANFYEEKSEDINQEFWDIYNMALELSNKQHKLLNYWIGGYI